MLGISLRSSVSDKRFAQIDQIDNDLDQIDHDLDHRSDISLSISDILDRSDRSDRS